MNDRDVIMMEEYIRNNLPTETKYFDIYAYSRWAAYEILERMINETMKLPSHISGKEQLSAVDIVESFIDEMDYYQSEASSNYVKNVFQIARDEGKCIMLYISTKGDQQ